MASSVTLIQESSSANQGPPSTKEATIYLDNAVGNLTEKFVTTTNTYGTVPLAHAGINAASTTIPLIASASSTIITPGGFLIPPKKVRTGSSYRFTINGTFNSTANETVSFNLLCGPNNSTADTVIFTGPSWTSSSGATTQPFQCTFRVTITNGSTGTAFGNFTCVALAGYFNDAGSVNIAHNVQIVTSSGTVPVGGNMFWNVAFLTGNAVTALTVLPVIMDVVRW